MNIPEQGRNPQGRTYESPWGDFYQSTQQATYFISNVTIDNILLDPDDWVGAFSPSSGALVGARQWGDCTGGTCDVPIMGVDDDT